MGRCATCGGEYNRTMDIRLNGLTSTYDCFECAIHALAPTCEHCGCRVIAHGVERDGKIFCCTYCAKQTGVHVMHT